MNKLQIKIKDESKAAIILNLLKELPFVEIEESIKKTERRKRKGNLADLFGIWEHRNITLNDIREKAWDRS